MLLKRLAERGHEVLREGIVVEEDMIAKTRVVAEKIGIGKMRVANRRPDMLLPGSQRGCVALRTMQLCEIHQVVIVVAGEKLVRRGAADRDLVTCPLHLLHQQPLDIVGDREYGGVMIAHELS